MEKIMISQPMAGLEETDIISTRDRFLLFAKENNYEVVNTLFTDSWYSQSEMESRGVTKIPLCFLAKSLENMSRCNVVYFADGWEFARGCRIEHQVAKDYGLEIIYESTPKVIN